VVGDDSYARPARISMPDGSEVSGWIRVEHDPNHNALVLSMAESLLPATSMVVARVRRMFDLDCDPETVFGGLAALDPIRPGANVRGTRLPGCFDPFETCCRAVLGQQVSVAAANKLAARIVRALGPQIRTGTEGLDRAWPSPSEFSSLDDVAGVLGPLGVIRTRSSVMMEIARMTVSGDLRFDALADPVEHMGKLLQVKGIGPWTANYIAMRALSYPDAFLEKDSGVAHALPDMTPKERIETVEPCRPWRSYAVISLWNSLGNEAPKPKGEQPS
jgi:AraC family transcriptional regulator of adaptative response / DNA-3-methyladenine glycosylase II